MSLKIGVIISTTRPTRVGPAFAKWFIDQVKDTPDVEFELIDLVDYDLPFLDEPESPMSGKYEHDYTRKWSEKIKSLDGFVFVTAEYNNGPPAALKNAIDMLYHEWGRKPVALVGYGTYGAARAIEQLVNVSAKIGMMPLVKTSVGIVKPWDAIDDDGNVKPDHVFGSVGGLVENLKWWGETLKTARTNG